MSTHSGTSNNPTPFTALNGKRIKEVGTNAVFFILEGKKCGITNPSTYSSIFRDWNNIWVLNSEMFNSIETGPTLSDDSRLIKSHTHPIYYLYTNGKKHGILSLDSFHYCNFTLWPPTSYTQSEIDNIPSGSVIDYKGFHAINNGTIQIGVDVNYGGGITHLSDYSSNGINLVNSFDKGRQIQQSYYGGPNDANYTYKPEGYQGPIWPYTFFNTGGKWPWNPIGVGDYLGNHSCAIQIDVTPDSLYVKTRPLQWALENVTGDCIFESWITLNGSAAKIKNRLTNFIKNQPAYDQKRAQELPAIYLLGMFEELYAYQGDKPFSGALPRKIDYPVPGPPWKQEFDAPEHWAAFVTRNNQWGVGAYNKDCSKFNAGYAGFPNGNQNVHALESAHMAPLDYIALTHDQVYEWEYHLVLGYLGAIRDYIYQVHTSS